MTKEELKSLKVTMFSTEKGLPTAVGEHWHLAHGARWHPWSIEKVPMCPGTDAYIKKNVFVKYQIYSGFSYNLWPSMQKVVHLNEKKMQHENMTDKNKLKGI